MVQVAKPMGRLRLCFAGETGLCFAEVTHTFTECSLVGVRTPLFRGQSLRSFALCWSLASADYYDRSDARSPRQPQLVQSGVGPVERASHVRPSIFYAGR